ncbi:hypothetical protein SERLA73DRAFT_56659 [Serpula lacrymans var. lacrymans S7.3]|uniref:E2 ubiquitin-conjugating enzyme n=1 Tax=Serpula lacrymans var. lacrymans (strain S7.3) TaxID=936435 RepID=F8Q1T3_SERL3|nr:hypothetical protein SERLA73DRAFT_56659 [Serpula lacrymans var. lacrymans S7.3]
MTVKRIHREVADVKKEDLGAITLAPSADNLFHWKGSIPGPQGSPYEGGVFNVDVYLTPDYPFSAPKVTLTTRIYHMNISDRGNICIDILKHNWSPALSLFKVMLSLSSLLTDPNPRAYLFPSIATEFIRNREMHDRTARRWTELYALPPPIVATSSSSTSPSTSTTAGSKLKGKEKAPSITRSSTSRISTSASATQAETITLSDSEDDAPVSSTTSSSRLSGKKRKRNVEVVDIDLVGDEVRNPKRRVGGSGGGISGREAQGTGEVIVIED